MLCNFVGNVDSTVCVSESVVDGERLRSCHPVGSQIVALRQLVFMKFLMKKNKSQKKAKKSYNFHAI